MAVETFLAGTFLGLSLGRGSSLKLQKLSVPKVFEEGYAGEYGG